MQDIHAENYSRKRAADTRPALPLEGDEREMLIADVPMLYYSDDDAGQDVDALDGDVEQAFALWRAECARSREIVAASTLDQTGIQIATGKPIRCAGFW